LHFFLRSGDFFLNPEYKQMSSVLASTRQVDRDGDYYIPLSSLAGLVYTYTESSNSFAAASFATTTNASYSTISTAYKSLLRDCGKTVVSSGRTFRKVQVVQTGAGFTSTGGVGGQTGVSGVAEYLTGYIELATVEGQGSIAPVAKFGR
jgi:hypothetical protein